MKALVLLCGPPGCGKTTWRTRFPTSQVVCLDEIRTMLTGSESDQSANATAAQIQNYIVFERMKRGLFTIVDATNARHEHRQPLIGHAYTFGLPVIAVIFDVSVEECMTRQAARNRQVPYDVIEKIAQDLFSSLPELAAATDIQVTIGSASHHINILGLDDDDDVPDLVSQIETWCKPIPQFPGSKPSPSPTPVGTPLTPGGKNPLLPPGH